MVQVTVLFHIFPHLRIFFGLAKTERPPKPLLGCQNWVTKCLSAWGTLATSGAGVVCKLHIYVKSKKTRFFLYWKEDLES